ncbi:helix-turn-helix domain-containing protein [Nonomuraea sp. NPDC048826]|uniref:helix-turn-helix domain-containing protein n=1 Tax=Nonomuraea sp. NPDC048826 TaxID=3364347 RepID=UPI00372159D5
MADSGQALAHRLRQLRVQQWPDKRIKQPQLAQALNVSVPLISSWENEANPKVPPVSRLEAYALLFCSHRSLRADDLVPLAEAELTMEESQLRDKLLQELLDLRAAALNHGPSPSSAPAVANPWQFDDGRQVVIVCTRLPDSWLARMPYVDPDDPHHIELYTYADLDSLFELHGHIRAFNPASEIRRHTAKELEPDDLTSHLVLLGGVDWNDLTTDVFQVLDLPVRQINDWESENGPYFSHGDRHFSPTLTDGMLREDVALFYRGPNPYNSRRTLTICNGMYGRGTLGVVRALTDTKFRDRNTEWIHERFGDGEAYALLSKVRVVRGQVITPDWTLDELRLVEWPD